MRRFYPQETNALFNLCCYLNACSLAHLDHLLHYILILLESTSLSADSLKDGRRHSSGFKIGSSNLVLNRNFSSSFI